MDNLIDLPFNLKGKIYRSPMPGSTFDIGKTTLSEMMQADINTVVMLNSTAEAQIYSGSTLLPKYKSLGFDTIYLPIKDFDTPENESDFISALNEIINKGKNGENIAIHCFAGLGRTGTVLAILARLLLSFEGQEAVNWVRDHVPSAIQTQSQANFVSTFPLEKLS